LLLLSFLLLFYMIVIRELQEDICRLSSFIFGNMSVSLLQSCKHVLVCTILHALQRLFVRSILNPITNYKITLCVRGINYWKLSPLETQNSVINGTKIRRSCLLTDVEVPPEVGGYSEAGRETETRELCSELLGADWRRNSRWRLLTSLYALPPILCERTATLVAPQRWVPQFNVFECVLSEEVNVRASSPWRSPLRNDILTALCKQTASATAHHHLKKLQTHLDAFVHISVCFSLRYFPLSALWLRNQQAGSPAEMNHNMPCVL